MSTKIFREILKKASKVKINRNVVEFQNKTSTKINNNEKNISWATDKEKRKYRASWINKFN